MRKLALSTLALLVGVATAVTTRVAWAGYSARPVRIVVGFGAGSAADVAARIVAEELSQTMRQRFFIENKPGAGATLPPSRGKRRGRRLHALSGSHCH
jgi:tripartite-type tricarboxylate transporter receptor subunit TctC